MPTVTFDSPDGFSMYNVGVEDIAGLIGGHYSTNRGSTFVRYVDGAGEATLFGTFPSFDQFGDPSSGTVTSFHLTGGVRTMSVTGLSIPVVDALGWIFTYNLAALNAAVFNGNDTITGTAFGDTLIGYRGTDTINGGDGADYLFGEAPSYSPFYTAAGENDTLNGGNGNDWLYGGGGDDTLNGGEGDDVIVIGSGADIIDGGGGYDRLEIDRSASSISINLNTLALGSGAFEGAAYQSIETFSVVGGAGADAFSFNSPLVGPFVVNGGDGVDTLTIDYSAGAAQLFMDTGSIGFTSGQLNFSNIERIFATGSAATDWLVGATGDDVLDGGGGDDRIYASAGADILLGGDGNDFVSFAGNGAAQANGGAGVDRLFLNLSAFAPGLTINATNLSGPSGLTLANGAVFTGFEWFSCLLTAGDDTLTMAPAQLGVDGSLDGGNGEDRLILDFSALASVNLTAGAFLSSATGSATLRGFEFFTITGGFGNDFIQAGGGADSLSGGAGDDVLSGARGDDVLSGGAGNDLLSGGENADSISGGAGVDTASYSFSSSLATWTRNPNGTWTVTGDGTDTLTGVEILRFLNRDVVLDNAQQTFSGDGTSDILWRRTDGLTATWAMSGTAQSGSALLGSVGNDWSIQGTGDFSGDGRDDILWQRNDGLVYLWNNASIGGAVFVAAASTAWDIQGVGDFNFDGNDDFLWRNPTSGQVAVWTMNGGSVANQAAIGAAGVEWSIQQVADFSGDGRDDILWRRDDGLLAIWNTNGTATTGSSIIGSVGAEWQITGSGDFNGDGYADILWQRNDGLMAIWEMNNTGLLAASTIGGVGTTWHVADVGDYNGDGRDDIFWRNDDGLLAVWTMNGFAVTSTGITGSVGAEWGII